MIQVFDKYGNLKTLQNTGAVIETDPVFATWLSGPPNLSEFNNDSAYITLVDIPAETDPIYSASTWFSTTNNSADWDTAFGWGDHSTVGYVTENLASADLFQSDATRNYFIDGTQLVFNGNTGIPMFRLVANNYSWVLGSTAHTSYLDASVSGAYINAVTSDLRLNGNSLNTAGGLATWSGVTSGFQPLDGDLTAIAALGFASTSFLTKTAANTWVLDTNTYLTTGSASSTYVPYTGATGSVELGAHSLGLGASPTSKVHIRTDSIGVTQTDNTGIILENTTAATNGNQQYSPSIVLRGQGYGTTAGATASSWLRMYNIPIQHTTVQSSLRIESPNTSGTAFDFFSIFQVSGTTGMRVSMNGGNTILAQGGGVTSLVGGSNGLSFVSSSFSTYATMSTTGNWVFAPNGLTGSSATSAIDISQTWNTSGNPSMIKATLTNTASGASSKLLELLIGSSNLFSIWANGTNVVGSSTVGFGAATATSGAGSATGTAMRFFSNVGSTAGAYDFHMYQNANRTATSGTNGGLRLSGTFAPTSGTGTFSLLEVRPTINQSGVTGTPITRGIYIDPTLTSASDFRSLDIAAGNTNFADAVNMMFGTSTGTKLGTATTQKIGFWNVTPIVQPTTAVTAATFAANTSAIADDTATFDGYTIGQIVKALRNLGILA